MAVIFGSPSFVLEKEEKTSQEETKKYIRLLFWGRARKKGDNNAFYFASLNVMKDYGKDGEIIRKAMNNAKDIVSLINSQKENSIQSIDFFYHGSQYALYMVRNKETKKGSSLNED